MKDDFASKSGPRCPPAQGLEAGREASAGENYGSAMRPQSSQTASLCPVCLRALPAAMVARSGEVFLERSCPEHGEISAVVWRGSPKLSDWSRLKNPSGAGHYETERKLGCPHDCGLCPEHRQHSCTVLFEITSACNLHCPVCFASSGEKEAGFTPLEILEQDLDWIRSEVSDIVLQISGGEPTLHPELPGVVRKAAALFPAVQLNTNGLELARNPDLCNELAASGLSWVFLQFDGTTDEIYRAIRGRALLAEKRQAIENCRQADLAVVLVPTLVHGVNDRNLGEILDLALENAPGVRGIHIQPMADMGRNEVDERAKQRITLPEVLTLLAEQSGGRVSPDHATPPGCEHERCSFHCRYVLGANKELKPIREAACCTASAQNSNQACCSPAALAEANGCCKPLPQKGIPMLENLSTDVDKSKQYHKDSGVEKAVNTIIRSWGNPRSPSESGSTDLEEDALSRFIREARQRTFSVTCMAFQDAMTVDLARLQGCCVHVFSPPGRLVPFCSYNLTALDGRPLHRGRKVR